MEGLDAGGEGRGLASGLKMELLCTLDVLFALSLLGVSPARYHPMHIPRVNTNKPRRTFLEDITSLTENLDLRTFNLISRKVPY